MGARCSRGLVHLAEMAKCTSDPVIGLSGLVPMKDRWTTQISA
jgi:hypothetical protein